MKWDFRAGGWITAGWLVLDRLGLLQQLAVLGALARSLKNRNDVRHNPAVGEDAEQEALIRRLPPERAISWVEVATGRRVVDIRVLSGGVSHATHGLRLTDRRDADEWVVLRRWARPDYLQTDPEFTATHEATTLRLLENIGIQAPRLIAADEVGAQSDVPAVLQTLIPGVQPQPDWDDPEGLVLGLAEAIAPLHELTSEEARAVALPYKRYYEIESISIPRWARRAEVWERAIEIAAEPEPGGERVFIHRDYHHGNTLWDRGRVAGITDWDRASWGSPSVDLARARQNLAEVFGLPVAERFTEVYREVTGRELKDLVYWDIVDALDSVPDLQEARWLPRAREAREDYVAEAIARY